jgi:hypothetical protein
MATKIAHTNRALVSGVTITASSEATGHPASYMAHPGRWKNWRSSTSTSAKNLDFDLGASLVNAVFGVVDAVLVSGGELQVQSKVLVGDPYVTVGTFAFPAFNPTGVSMVWTAATGRYVRFLFTNPGAVSAFAQLGVAFIAASVVVLAKTAPGPTFQRVDPSVQRRAIGGARTSVLRPKYSTYEGRQRLLTAAERDTYAAMWETIGSTQPAILALDENAPQLVGYGILDSFAPEHRVEMANEWDIPFAFVEDVA